MEQWSINRKLQKEQDAAFDKNLIALAAGSFAVSFTFIDKVVPMPLTASSNPYFLVIAWVLFALCLTVSLFGLRISSAIHSFMCKENVRFIELGCKSEPYIQKKAWYAGWATRLLNWAAFISFVGGVSCLILFVFFNVP
jgi:hypothetical protein